MGLAQGAPWLSVRYRRPSYEMPISLATDFSRHKGAIQVLTVTGSLRPKAEVH